MRANLHLFLALVLAVGAGNAMADYDAVISLRPATAGSCIAVEMDASPSAVLAGISWFHNDGTAVFPQVAIVEGVPGTPPDLTTPGIVLDTVTGVSLDWGEFYLSSPVVSSTGTAYAVFFYPIGSAANYLGEGGGAGIGVREKPGSNPAFYLSGDGENWAQFDSGFELGVTPLYASLRGTPDTIAEMGTVIGKPAPSGDEQPAPASHATVLHAPSVNPFNPRTELSYSLAADTEVTLNVYDVRGRLVAELVSGPKPAGTHDVVWEGKDQGGSQVASGVYYARFEAGSTRQTQRLVLVR